MYQRFKWSKVSHRRNWITQEYEPLQPYFLFQLCLEVGAEAFVDVGANVGVYSVFMSQAVRQLVSFEANHALVGEIKDNFTLNDINGRIRPVAVSARPGTVEFGIVSQYAGNSAVVEQGQAEVSYSAKTSVEAVCLDDELAQMEGPIVLKIDVEGHELSVLRGAEKTLSEKRCVIQIENFENAVNEFLLSRGYRILTSIGPDTYFTNIEEVSALTCFEKSAAAMIEANHECKSMSFGRGGLSLVISGKTYKAVRRIAESVLRGRL